jgi:segregation and condensation protein A
LAARLAELAAIRAAAHWLGSRPQLGQEVFARGAAEEEVVEERPRLVLRLPALLRAYIAARRRGTRAEPYRPPPRTLLTVREALERLRRMLGAALVPEWIALGQFIPEELLDPVERRAAMASTLVAGLEMARTGDARLRQDRAFGPIYVGGATGATE